jgi:hypothetical protein
MKVRGKWGTYIDAKTPKKKSTLKEIDLVERAILVGYGKHVSLI